MKMERKDKIPWMLPKTLMTDLCHPPSKHKSIKKKKKQNKTL